MKILIWYITDEFIVLKDHEDDHGPLNTKSVF